MSRFIGRAWAPTQDSLGNKIEWGSPEAKVAKQEVLHNVLLVVGIYAIFLGLSGARRGARLPPCSLLPL